MFNVKSRKLVLTLFCSLALVLVLTDVASANSGLDGHRMLRKRAPELVGRQGLGNIIEVGTKGEGEGPGNPVSSSSSTVVSVNISLFRTMLNSLRLLAVELSLVTATFKHFPDLPHVLHLSELQFQCELILLELLIVLLLHRAFPHSTSPEQLPLVHPDHYHVSGSENRVQDHNLLRFKLHW